MFAKAIAFSCSLLLFDAAGIFNGAPGAQEYSILSAQSTRSCSSTHFPNCHQKGGLAVQRAVIGRSYSWTAQFSSIPATLPNIIPSLPQEIGSIQPRYRQSYQHEEFRDNSLKGPRSAFSNFKKRGVISPVAPLNMNWIYSRDLKTSSQDGPDIDSAEWNMTPEVQESTSTMK